MQIRSSVSRVLPILVFMAGVACNSDESTGPTPAQLSFTYCRITPIWFAVQDGDGTWQRILPTGTAQYSFEMSKSTGAVAYVTQGSTAENISMRIVYASVAQLTELGQSQCAFTGAKTASVTVVRRPSDIESMGFGFSHIGPNTLRLLYTFDRVPNEPVDLVAASSSPAGNRLVIRRGLAVADGATLPQIDFTSNAEGFVPDTRTATVTGGGLGESLSLESFYAPNRLMGISYDIGMATNVSAGIFTYPVLPANQIVAGDLHETVAMATSADGFMWYSLSSLAHNPQNVVMVLPGAPAAATVSIATVSPHVRPHFAIARQTQYGDDANIFFVQNGSGFSRQLLVEWTNAYTGSTAIDYTLPDLSGVAGFNSAWALKVGTQASWQLAVEGRSMAKNAMADGAFWVDGQQRAIGSRFGFVTPVE